MRVDRKEIHFLLKYLDQFIENFEKDQRYLISERQDKFMKLKIKNFKQKYSFKSKKS